jgi:hypothetical protein
MDAKMKLSDVKKFDIIRIVLKLENLEVVCVCKDVNSSMLRVEDLWSSDGTLDTWSMSIANNDFRYDVFYICSLHDMPNTNQPISEIAKNYIVEHFPDEIL